MARFALNFDRLTPRARALADELGVGPDVRNPFRSIVIRSLEVVLACEEAARILREYRPPPAPSVPPTGRFDAGLAAAATEAPRGLLFHRYELARDGRIERAKIVAPTSQNQKRIEEDLRHLIERSLAMDDAPLTDACERAIRNHDPCISCATHFLRLDVERR